MTATESFDAGIARQIGHYADAVRVPADYDQILLQNIETTLNQAGASLRDIVSVRQWLTSAEDVRAYVEVRNRFITHTPVFMLGVIPGLVRPDFLIETEVVAAVLAGKRT